jgi:hypothetical protein
MKWMYHLARNQRSIVSTTRPALNSSGRRLTATALSLVMTAAMLLMAPSSANAASESGGDGRVYSSSTCGGLGYTTDHRVRNQTVSDGRAQLQVFYSRSKNANCAQLINLTNSSTYMSVRIERSSNSGDYAVNGGNFSSYAGAVVLTNAGSSCITLAWYMHSAGSWIRNVHCG